MRKLSKILPKTLFVLSCTLVFSCLDYRGNLNSPVDRRGLKINVELAWTFLSNGGIRGTSSTIPPTIDGGRVYYLEDKSIIARDLISGSEIWSNQTRSTSINVADNMIVSNNVLYVLYSDMLLAYETVSGELLWSNDTLEIGFSSMRRTFSETENHLLIAGSMRRVFSVSKETGEIALTVEWSQQSRPDLSENVSNMVTSEDKFVYVTVDGVFGESGAIFCYSGVTGDFVWEYNVPYATEQNGFNARDIELLEDKLIIKGGRRVFALNRSSGNLLWERVLESESYADPGLTAANNKVFSSAANGDVFCYDAISGNLLWHARSGVNVMIYSLVARNNFLFFHDVLSKSEVWILDPDTGNSIWANRLLSSEGKYNDMQVREGYMIILGSEQIFAYKLPE